MPPGVNRSDDDTVSTNCDDGSTDVSASLMGETSSSSGFTMEELRLARRMQGCEVEYLFPHSCHEELEGALMLDEDDEDEDEDEDSSSSDDDSTRAESRTTCASPRISRRGRSPSSRGVISPIVAIPTNGEGCVVLRENGTFDVVGKIPEVLHEKLFRRNGPLPDCIALGTL